MDTITRGASVARFDTVPTGWVSNFSQWQNICVDFMCYSVGRAASINHNSWSQREQRSDDKNARNKWSKNIHQISFSPHGKEKGHFVTHRGCAVTASDHRRCNAVMITANVLTTHFGIHWRCSATALELRVRRCYLISLTLHCKSPDLNFHLNVPYIVPNVH